jgi:hypothetical protein
MKIFEPQKVFEYSVAIIATMVAAGSVMGVAHLLITLAGKF